MTRRYNGHPHEAIDHWFDPTESLARYDPVKFCFDPAAAQKAVDFFTLYLTHVKGEWKGRPLVLEDWQFRTVRDVFGWKRVQDGMRKYRTLYVEVPRKNGKSTLGAGFGLLLTLADDEPCAEVYSAAADRDQAAIIFDIAKQMVVQSPPLKKRCTLFRRSIYVHATGSLYKVLSADAPTKHGLNASGIIFDELHTQPNRDLYDVLVTSTASRRQPLVAFFTTAGYDEKSICFQVHEYAKKVLAGLVPDETFYAVIFAADEKDDYTDEKIWKKANPNLGITPKLDYFRAKIDKAKETPADRNVIKRLHLNVWTRQAEVWMPMDKWKACGAALELEGLAGKVCYAGLDLSTNIDLSSLVLVFPRELEGAMHYDVLARFWIPKENIHQRVHRDRVEYDVWVNEGFVFATEGNIIDYDFIRAQVNEFGTLYDVREVAIDRWNATQLTTQLEGDGFTVVPFGQGFASMSGPTKELMTAVLSSRLHHGGNPVLDWMASNVSVNQDPAGNLKPDKAKSRDRIDGMVALIMAFGRAYVAPDDGSVYDERGIEFV